MPSHAAAPDAASWARYEGLTLHVRAGFGDRPGEHRLPGRSEPAGIELEAYAPYTPGDDLRHLDWSTLGRLDQLLVRRYTAEREALVHLLVDLSASMAVPAHEDKLGAACSLVRALAFIALAAGDAIRLAWLGGEAPRATSPVLRQRAALRQVDAALDGARAAGALELGAALEAHARRHPLPGVAVVVSDFMGDPAGVEHGVQALRARGWAVLLLHVVAASELDPEAGLGGLLGHVVLRDAESGETHPVLLTPATRARYRALVTAHLAALQGLAERTETHYARLVAGTSVADFVTLELVCRGIVRRRRR
jgi:hypothetical protein